MGPIRAVLFDWGDTLFASPDAARVIVNAARERGANVSHADARAVGDHAIADGGAEQAGLRFHHLVGEVGPGGVRGLREVIDVVERSGMS